jgi:hypothetical protein
LKKILLSLSIIIFSAQSIIDGVFRRYAHGDGSFKYIYVLSNYFNEDKFSPVSDPRIARDYIVAFKQIFAFFSLQLDFNVEQSFRVFCLTISILYISLYIVMSLAINKFFNNWFGIVASITLLALAATSMSFPDAEIILASPIIILWSLFFSNLDKYSVTKKRVWLVGALTLFLAAEIHEAFVIVMLANLIIFSIRTFKSKSLNRPQLILLVFSFLPLTKGLFNIITYSSEAATEKSIFYESIFFNFKLWPYKPSVLIMCALFSIYSLKHFIYFKQTGIKFVNKLFTPLLGLIILLTFVIYSHETNRTSNPWSFLQSRQDLFWTTIVISFVILAKGFHSKKTDFKQLTKTGSLFILFFMLSALSLFTLRMEESFTWEQCKKEELSYSSLLGAKGYEGVVDRTTWPIRDCDWLWADPGTIYLLDSRKFPISIPDGVINSEQRSQWPEPPEVDLNTTEVRIFGLNVPPSSQSKFK